jgi:hypothetical protein
MRLHTTYEHRSGYNQMDLDQLFKCYQDNYSGTFIADNDSTDLNLFRIVIEWCKKLDCQHVCRTAQEMEDHLRLEHNIDWTENEDMNPFWKILKENYHIEKISWVLLSRRCTVCFGSKIDIKILEEKNLMKAVKKESWYLTQKINNSSIWQLYNIRK